MDFAEPMGRPHSTIRHGHAHSLAREPFKVFTKISKEINLTTCVYVVKMEQLIYTYTNSVLDGVSRNFLEIHCRVDPWVKKNLFKKLT